MHTLRDRGVSVGEKHKSGLYLGYYSLRSLWSLRPTFLRTDTTQGAVEDWMADPGSQSLMVLSRLQCPVLSVSHLLPEEKLDSFQKIKSQTASENQLHQEEIAQAIPLVCL